MAPDPFWNFPVIVLLGESENRLACILGSIPIFWPVLERAVERVHNLYRIMVTQEFVVQSTRVLPGEITVEVGAYEAPHWAEQANEDEQNLSANLDGGEKAAGPHLSDISLPRWPEFSDETDAAAVGDAGQSMDKDEQKVGGKDMPSEGPEKPSGSDANV